MVIRNLLILSSSLLILYINIFLVSSSLYFYNLQSEKLSNGNFIFVHQYGIDIFDKNLSEIVKCEITFTEEEQITNEKMKNVIIRKFVDGSIICLIDDYIYIFDGSGNFLNKYGNISKGYNVSYFSLSVTNANYQYFIGLISGLSLYLKYYEYHKGTNSNSNSNSAHSSEIKIDGDNPILIKGLSCHYYESTTIICFISYSKNGDCYLLSRYYYVSGNLIKQKEGSSEFNQKISNKIEFFKVDINLSKAIALICGFLENNLEFCFNFDISNYNINLNYFDNSTLSCLHEYYGFNLKYYSTNNEFVFSCLGYPDNNIKYVIYNLTNNIYTRKNYFELNEGNKCDYFDE